MTRLLLGSLNNGHLSSSQQGGDTTGIDKTRPDDLEGVKDTGLDHVNVLALGAVETLVEVTAELISQLANNDGALKSSVLDDCPRWAGDGVLNDGHTELLVEVGSLDTTQGLARGLQKSGTTTGQDTLLDGSPGGVQGIHKAVLLLADLNLGGAADLDDGNTTGKLGKTLLELLLLVVRGGGVSHDATDLLTSLSDGVLGALAVEHDGVLLGDGDGASCSEHVDGGLLELDVQLLGEDSAVGKDSNVAEDRLAVVTEARGLDGSHLELTAQLVEDADSQSLTLDVLGNDDQRSASLGGDLEGRDDVLDGRDFLLGQKDEGVLELHLLGLGIGNEVRRDEATVESHTLGNLELVAHGLALLDGDDTLLANLLHGVGNQLSDVCVTVGRDSGDLGDLLTRGDIPLVLLQELHDGIDSGLDTAAEVHGVAAGGDVLDGLGEDGPGKDCGSSGTVTGDLVGLGGDVLQQLGTEVLKLVLQAGLDQDVSALRTQGSGDSPGERVNTSQESSTALNSKLQLLKPLLAP
ncbi:hypothetical protein VP1G_11450 [Cytospora mali]|uniref:Uncharacterized protein n=1 Tax=Cytospora mali TaxID=578113 RepID=A0A194VGQ0_CYTMA|nr:hypothetical protein VP1G_11450 [Valsa mali var. pyri (nom. inval.)]